MAHTYSILSYSKYEFEVLIETSKSNDGLELGHQAWS